MVAIAPVTQATLPLLSGALRALADDMGDPYHLSDDALAHALFADPPACHAVLARQGAALRGMALFSPVLSTTLGAAGVYVSDLWVAPDARGGGLGPALLADVGRRGHDLWGAGFLKLASYDDNTRALAFYGRRGFLPAEGETVLRLTGAAFETLVRTG